MSDVSADLAVDLGTSDGGVVADLLGKIHIGINDSIAEQRKANQLEQRRLAGLPNYFTISKVSQVAGTDTINFGGPQNGRQWEVALLFAMDSLQIANAAIITWYVGQDMRQGTTALMQITMARWQFPSLPSMKDFGGGQITIQPNEVLIAQIVSAPAGKSIVMNVGINDMIQDDARFAVSVS